ncbi:unnamed protein product, partial [Porites evermanni]
KFGERSNKPQTHVIRSAYALYALLNDPSFHISNIRICSEDVLEVVTTRAEEEVEQNVKTNIFIAIYTTAHARLKLYSALETLQEQLDDPQEERRNITLVDKNFFDRDQTNKRIRLIDREKKYGLVFDKRVVDRATRKSYPYGYARIGSEVDMLSEL